MFSGLGGQDARPCVTRVRSVILERCPASALKCFEPGPLGDASGSFSFVLASVNVIFVVVSSCMWLTVCESLVKYITGCIRVVCEFVSLGVRCVYTAQNRKHAQNAFLNAPLRGEGRASTQGWGALLAISSSPLVPYGPEESSRSGVSRVL